MDSSTTMLYHSMDRKKKNDVLTTSLIGILIVAVRLIGPQFNKVAMLSMHSCCVISLVMLTFLLDIVLLGCLEISYHIPSITIKVIEAYKGGHVSNILLYEFKHIR